MHAGQYIKGTVMGSSDRVISSVLSLFSAAVSYVIGHKAWQAGCMIDKACSSDVSCKAEEAVVVMPLICCLSKIIIVQQ